MARLHRMDLTHPIVRDKAQQVCVLFVFALSFFLSLSLSLSHYKTCIRTITFPLIPSHPTQFRALHCTALLCTLLHHTVGVLGDHSSCVRGDISVPLHR